MEYVTDLLFQMREQSLAYGSNITSWSWRGYGHPVGFAVFSLLFFGCDIQCFDEFMADL